MGARTEYRRYTPHRKYLDGSWKTSCSGEKPVGEGEGARRFRRARPAWIVHGRRRRLVLDQRDRSGCRGPRRIKRVWAIRCDDDEIHLRTQIDKIAWPLASLLPAEAARFVQRYRREEGDRGRNIPDIEPDLGSGGEKVLLRVARCRAERGKRRGRRRAADQKIVRAAGVLDQRDENASYVRQDDPAFSNSSA